ETWRLLETARLRFPNGGIASNAGEAVRIATRIGFPVAMKLSSYLIVHKTEVEGVHLNLKNEEDVRLAFQAITNKLIEMGRLDAMQGVLIQPMLAGGVEVMVGVTQDPLFGPLIAFGLGGIHVEILGDVSFRVTPLTDQDASAMIKEIKGYRLLKGYRGHPAADIAKLEEMLLRVSRLVEAIPEITELDFNPVFAFAPGSGCTIADARVRLDHASPSLIS
ncbi:MAG TPA: acetate--CoA ligase family protein, partial [Acidobacteriota bacterium]|nr:acetate--CoA ligase family protein [Acidobacteriota bacterium]